MRMFNITNDGENTLYIVYVRDFGGNEYLLGVFSQDELTQAGFNGSDK